MNPIETLKLDEEVPDEIYLSAVRHARTPEEIAFRDVLIFHRDALNGGLDQALDNQVTDPGQLARFIQAFDLIGLGNVAALIRDGHAELSLSGPTSASSEFDALADRYTLFAYGQDGDQPDAIERHAIAFAQSRSDAFSNVVARATALEAELETDSLLWRIGDLARGHKEQS